MKAFKNSSRSTVFLPFASRLALGLAARISAHVRPSRHVDRFIDKSTGKEKNI